MAQKMSSSVPQTRRARRAQQQSVLTPYRPRGWWVLALLVVAAAAPLWWAPVESVLHDNWVQIGGAVVLALAALVAGAVEVFVSKDYSVLLVLAFAAVLVEVMLVVVILGLLTLGLVQLE